MYLRQKNTNQTPSCYFLPPTAGEANRSLGDFSAQCPLHANVSAMASRATLSGILPGYSCKEEGRVEDGFLLEFPCTPTRTRSV
jgi:hypothetical protein